jgi:hypothetical protein
MTLDAPDLEVAVLRGAHLKPHPPLAAAAQPRMRDGFAPAPVEALRQAKEHAQALYRLPLAFGKAREFGVAAARQVSAVEIGERRDLRDLQLVKPEQVRILDEVPSVLVVVVVREEHADVVEERGKAEEFTLLWAVPVKPRLACRVEELETEALDNPRVALVELARSRKLQDAALADG